MKQRISIWTSVAVFLALSGFWAAASPRRDLLEPFDSRLPVAIDGYEIDLPDLRSPVHGTTVSQGEARLNLGPLTSAADVVAAIGRPYRRSTHRGELHLVYRFPLRNHLAIDGEIYTHSFLEVYTEKLGPAVFATSFLLTLDSIYE